MSTPYAAPSTEYILGTDALGQSFAPLLATGYMFTVAEVAVASLIALGVGFSVAIVSVKSKGAFGQFLFRTASTFSFATPLLAILLLLYGMFGDVAAIFPLASGLLLWGGIATVLQPAISQEWKSDHIVYAKNTGFSTLQVLRYQMLPNLKSHIIAAWLGSLPILLIANILVGFLGANGSNARIGYFLKTGFDLFPGFWWLWLPPMALTSISFVLVFVYFGRFEKSLKYK